MYVVDSLPLMLPLLLLSSVYIAFETEMTFPSFDLFEYRFDAFLGVSSLHKAFLPRISPCHNCSTQAEELNQLAVQLTNIHATCRHLIMALVPTCPDESIK